jgi:hypothetical protein
MINVKEKKSIHKEKIGPDMTLPMVAEALGETLAWVARIVRRKPEDYPDGKYIPGYIRVPGSQPVGPDQWLAKDFVSIHSMEKPRGNNEGRTYCYREDVEAYKRRFPLKGTSEDEQQTLDFWRAHKPDLLSQVEAVALPEFNEFGYVTRTRVKRVLVEKYGYSDRIQASVSAICDSHNWPMSRKRHPGKRQTVKAQSS